MKKKILVLSLSILCAIAMLAFSACGDGGTISKLEVTSQPSTTFTQKEDFTADDITKYLGSVGLKYTANGTESTFTIGEAGSQVVIVNFSLATVGSFTATISYSGSVVAFDYTVVKASSEASEFAGGTGVAGDPYQIANLDQFLKIDGTHTDTKYYVLTADIDFTNAVIKGTTTPLRLSVNGADLDNADGTRTSISDCVIADLNNCVLDGNGHKLYNIAGSEAGGTAVLAHCAKNATIKNLDVYTVGNGCLSLVAYSAGEYLTFENVDAYGTVLTENHNYGFYAVYSASRTQTFNSCDSHVTIDGTAKYLAAYVGYPYKRYGGNNYIFNNCKNYGNITAQKSAVLFGNVSQFGAACSVTINNCENYGTLMGIGAIAENANTDNDNVASYVFATGTNKGTITKTGTGIRNVGNGRFLGLSATNYFTHTTNADGHIEITNASSEVAYYVVQASYSCNYSTVDGGVSGTSYMLISERLTTPVGSKFTCAHIGDNKIKVLTALGDLSEEGMAATGKGWNIIKDADVNTYYIVNPYNDGVNINTFGTNPILKYSIMGFNADGVAICGYIK